MKSQDFWNGAEYAEIVFNESGPVIACQLGQSKGHLDKTQTIDFVKGYVWRLIQRLNM